MNSKKIAVCTISYREDWAIESVIKNWEGKCYKHLILESSQPWHGIALRPDKTQEVCAKYAHVEFVTMPWKSEAEQRNWGLARLWDYDYVLTVDSDELYTESDQFKILERIGQEVDFEDNRYCYRVPTVNTYFKTPEYRLDPRDTHEPLIACDPKHILFTEARIPNSQFQIPIDVILHHISYLRPDKRLFYKLGQFEHFNQIKPNWFEEKWKTWTPEMENVRAFGHEDSKAIIDPLPDELKKLL